MPGFPLARPLLILALLAAGDVRAQALSGEAAVVSDYRFRGYSLSDEQPALQAGVTLEAGGFYGNVWGSTIDEYGQDADGKGATVELDFTVGRAWDVGSYGLDVGLSAYTYPRGEKVNYLEIPVSVTRAAGDWSWTLGAAYAPPQANLGDEDNVYVYGALAVAPADWIVSLDASLGWEDGVFADQKLDWSLGVSKPFGPLTLGVRYADADALGADAAVVGSLGIAF